MDYASTSNNEMAKAEPRNCAVIAVSVAANVEYEVAYNKLQQFGRRHGTGTKFFKTQNAMESLGFTLTTIHPQAKTVKTIGREFPLGTFLVRVRGHILTLKNGSIEDWSAGRQFRIRHMYLVTKTGEPALIPMQPATAPAPIIAYPHIHAPAPVAQAITPTPSQPPVPRSLVKLTIRNVAWAYWEENGKVATAKEILVQRKAIMDILEGQGIKRNTASNELGAWQKELLSTLGVYNALNQSGNL